jgi:hypothetical protein
MAECRLAECRGTLRKGWVHLLNQGILNEGDGSVRLTSLSQLVQIGCFCTESIHSFFYKTSFLVKEVNCTEHFPLSKGSLVEPSMQKIVKRNRNKNKPFYQDIGITSEWPVL